jgi:hypothetical protein
MPQSTPAQKNKKDAYLKASNYYHFMCGDDNSKHLKHKFIYFNKDISMKSFKIARL